MEKEPEDCKRARMRNECAEDLRLQMEMNAAVRKLKGQKDLALEKLHQLDKDYLPGFAVKDETDKEHSLRAYTSALKEQIEEKRTREARMANTDTVERDIRRLEIKDDNESRIQELKPQIHEKGKFYKRILDRQIRDKTARKAEQINAEKCFDDVICVQTKQPSSDEVVQSHIEKVRRYNEEEDFIRYMQQIRSDRKKLESELEKLHTAEANKQRIIMNMRKEVAKDKHVNMISSTIKAKPTSIYNARSANLAKRMTGSGDCSFLEVMFDADEQRSKPKGGCLQQERLPKWNAIKVTANEEDSPKVLKEEPAGMPRISPGAQYWRRIPFESKPAVTVWTGEQQVVSINSQ